MHLGRGGLNLVTNIVNGGPGTCTMHVALQEVNIHIHCIVYGAFLDHGQTDIQTGWQLYSQDSTKLKGD